MPRKDDLTGPDKSADIRAFTPDIALDGPAHLPAITESADVRAFDADTLAGEMERVGALLGVNLSIGDDELLDFGIQEFNRAAWSLARAGVYFEALKARVGHGEFIKAVESRGVPGRRAQEAMQFSRLLRQLPESDVRRLVTMPKSKAIELAKADPEVIQDLLESGEADELQALSVRELHARIKKLEADKANLAVQLDTKQIEARELKNRLANRHTQNPLPEFAATVRQETGAMTEQMDLALELLEQLFDQHLADIGIAGDDPDYQRYRRMAAGTLFHSLHGIAARTEALLSRIHDAFGMEVTGRVAGEFILSQEEQQRYREERALILGIHQHEKAKRDAIRANNQPGRRGRKRKIED